MFRLDIYIRTKCGEKRVKQVARNIPTFEEADLLCRQKNLDLGVGEDGVVALGHKFAMFDNQ